MGGVTKENGFKRIKLEQRVWCRTHFLCWAILGSSLGGVNSLGRPDEPGDFAPEALVSSCLHLLTMFFAVPLSGSSSSYLAIQFNAINFSLLLLIFLLLLSHFLATVCTFTRYSSIFPKQFSRTGFFFLLLVLKT